MKILRRALVAFLFTAALARPAGAQVNSRFAAGGEFTVAASDRAQKLLGWRPQLGDLETIVAHALAWERKLLAAVRQPAHAG